MGSWGWAPKSQQCWKARTLTNDSVWILMPSFGRQLLLNWSCPLQSGRIFWNSYFKKGTFMWKCKEYRGCVSFPSREGFLHLIASTFQAGPPNLSGLNKPCLWVVFFSNVSFRPSGCWGDLCLLMDTAAARTVSCTWDLSHDGIRDNADLSVGGSGYMLYIVLQ